jgi:hypothetical protein
MEESEERMWVFRERLWIRNLAVVAIALLAVVTCRVEKPTEVKAKKWFITVGPDPCDLKEKGQPAKKQEVSKKGRDFVVWQSDSGESLTIRIHVPSDCPSPPFGGMTSSGTDPNGYRIWTFSDAGGTIFSGPVLKEACETDDRGYKYDQILGGDKECDGWIIIKP